MDLLKNIRQHIAENDMPSALAELEQETLNKNQQDDVLSFKQQLNRIRKDNQNGVQPQEQITARELKLSRDILEFTNLIVNGEYEELPKPSFREKITQTSPKYLVAAILLLEIMIGILGELMPDEIKPVLENLVGKENYWIAWTIVLVLTIAIFLYLTFRKEKPKTPTTEINLLATETEKITENLIERYESRLIQKTGKRLPVDLKLTYTKAGTSDDYKHWDKGIRVSQKLKDNWVETLKKHQHILIIGQPGAGKSTQLLELAVAWLKEETCTQIPVVFNLAPWTKTDQHFHEWLEAALISGYGFSKILAKEAVDNNQILPLLDGLDEVGTKETDDAAKAILRSHCLDAIDRYLSLFDLPYTVICSRIDEYTTATNAPIKAEVLINPLTPKQIKQTLSNALKENLHNQDENAARNLLDLIKNHPTLETVLCTPFYYNAALDVFGDRTQQYDLPDIQADLERYLVEAFLDKRFVNTENKLGYSEAKSRHYLGFVASVLDMENTKTFELISFQSWHLTKKWRMNLVYVLVYALVGGLYRGFYGGLYGSLVVGLHISLVSTDEAKLREIHREISWSKLLKLSTWVYSLVRGLVRGFAFGFVFGFAFGFVFVFVFVFGFVGGFVFGLVNELFETYTFHIKKTYHRLTREVLFSVLQLMLIISLAILSAKYFQGELQTTDEIYYSLGLGLLGGMVAGLLETALFKHFILRFALNQEQKLPLRWVSFFTYATKARILEQDGGQWRFRHQILEDYFLEEWKKKN